ncbi:uncharacterized protein LOC135492621 isoform X2 [Lineus longissimus]
MIMMNSQEKYTLFFGKDSPFSQHYPCNFKIGSVTYNCAEQYMMHQKAVVFGDQDMAKKILATTDPKQQKKYGRKVQNFIKDVWNQKSLEVVKEASMAKFSQDALLSQALRDTEGTVLVECSPRDRLWGIGLGKNNPKAHVKKNWRGKNLLGYVLTEVRDALLKKDTDLSDGTVMQSQRVDQESSEIDTKNTAKRKDIAESVAKGTENKSKGGLGKGGKKGKIIPVTPTKDKIVSEIVDSKNTKLDGNKLDQVDIGMYGVVTDANPDSDGDTKTVDKCLGASGSSCMVAESEPDLGDVAMETDEASDTKRRGKVRKADSSDDDDYQHPSKKNKVC